MSDDFEEVLRRFRREMLGPMVAHMDDGQVEAWLKPFELPEAKEEPGFPPWLKKRFDEERGNLLRLLDERCWQLEAMEMERDWAEAKRRGEI